MSNIFKLSCGMAVVVVFVVAVEVVSFETKYFEHFESNFSFAFSTHFCLFL